MKKGIHSQNGDCIRDFTHLLYFIIREENYWYVLLPVQERPFCIWINLLKLRPILGVIIREIQGYNLMKMHVNGG